MNRPPLAQTKIHHQSDDMLMATLTQIISCTSSHNVPSPALDRLAEELRTYYASRAEPETLGSGDRWLPDDVRTKIIQALEAYYEEPTDV